MSKRTFDEFDSFAKDYREIHSKNLSLSGADSLYFARMKVELLKQFHDSAPQRVLDLGCGDGATEIFMQQYFPGWKVIGIDVSEKSIEVAREKKMTSAEFMVYNGSDIPFTEGMFDLVFIAGVFHHVNFSLHNKLVIEIMRVLKPGGILYLFEHNPYNPLTKFLVKTCEFDKDAKLLPYPYTSGLLTRNGLEVLSRQFIIFLPRKSIFKKMLFIEKYLKWLPVGGQYFFRAQKPV